MSRPEMTVRLLEQYALVSKLRASILGGGTFYRGTAKPATARV
jgi:hypothetical protein